MSNPQKITNPSLHSSNGRQVRVNLVLALCLFGGLICSALLGFILVQDDTDRNEISPLLFGRLIEPINDCKLRLLGRSGWRKAYGGDVLFAEEAVFVGDDSAATIQLDDGGSLRLDEQSLVVLDKSGFRRFVDIHSGRVSAMSSTIGIDLRLGTSTVSIDPGEAVIANRDGDKLSIQSLNGEVDLSVKGKKLRLSSKSISEITDGNIARRSIEVQLIAPANSSIVYQVARQPQGIVFRWSPRRERLILVVSRDRVGTERVIEQQVEDTEYHVEGLEPGAYSWWLIDDTEHRQVSAMRSFSVVTLQSPKCSVPPDEAMIVLSAGNLLTLGWTLPMAATSFSIDLANDPSFSQLVLTHQTTSSHWTLSSLAEGTYYWRVTATYRGFQQLTSVSSSFRVITRTVPNAPYVLRTEVE